MAAEEAGRRPESECGPVNRLPPRTKKRIVDWIQIVRLFIQGIQNSV